MKLTQIERTADQVREAGVIAIIRGKFSVDDMLRIAEALREGGITLLEVTLNSTDALRAVSTLRQQCGEELLIGAGTVRTVMQAESALAAGAQFVVSPNFDPASVELTLRRDVLHLPGVATATEAHNALMAGCQMMKLFPADALGGPAYLKALRAPLDDIEFVPTGGISANNLAEYVRAGAAAVAVGSSLVSDKDWSVEQIKSRAAKLRETWESAARKD